MDRVVCPVRGARGHAPKAQLPKVARTEPQRKQRKQEKKELLVLQKILRKEEPQVASQLAAFRKRVKKVVKATLPEEQASLFQA